MGRDLSPLDTLPFRLQVPLAEVLADSLPNGPYWVGVELELLNDSLRPPEWETRYRFAAGQVELRREPDLPPSIRIDGSVRVEAATRLVPGSTRNTDSVKTFVLMTNTSDEARHVVIVRGNPLTVYAFRSAAARDSLPVPRPTYTMRGAGHIVRHRFLLGGRQKRLFENSAAVSDIVGAAGPGQYFFLAWLMGDPAFTLSADSLRLDQ